MSKAYIMTYKVGPHNYYLSFRKSGVTHIYLNWRAEGIQENATKLTFVETLIAMNKLNGIFNNLHFIETYFLSSNN